MQRTTDAQMAEQCVGTRHAQLAYDACRIFDETSAVTAPQVSPQVAPQVAPQLAESVGAAAGSSPAVQGMDADQMVQMFYRDPSDAAVLAAKPWRADPHHFDTAYVSAMAATKMATHARSGGSIEIMGMLVGKIFSRSIVVLDCYPLPVEGTETRVNAQSEAYEFMVQYLDTLKRTGRREDIVGWYHSHPGYGCWLSGIDVATQELNQQFQDPYLAIVVDPERTVANDRIEIGAFRTIPRGADGTGAQGAATRAKSRGKTAGVPDSKLKDFGVHHDRYYSLDVKFFQSNTDRALMASLMRSMSTDLVYREDRAAEQCETESLLEVAKVLENYKISNVVMSNIPGDPRNLVAAAKPVRGERVQAELVQTSNSDSDVEDSGDAEMQDHVGTGPAAPAAVHSVHAVHAVPQDAAADDDLLAQLRSNIAGEVGRIFREPPLDDARAVAGGVAAVNLAKLMNLEVQEQLFGGGGVGQGEGEGQGHEE